MAKINLEEIEIKWSKFWEENNIYKFDKDSEKKVYSIDTPPPTISGQLHMGHVGGYVPTDFIARYKRMRGYNVFFPIGFDDNGLPTERYVEKVRKIKGNKMPRHEFIDVCLEVSAKNEEEYKDIYSRLGISYDWDLMYSTIDERARRISQRSFLDLKKQDRAYRKESPTIFCVHCQTSVAQAELEDKDFESSFNHIYFELEGGKKIEIATTRPELLPACVGIVVNPKDDRYKDLIGKKAKVPLFDHEVEIIADDKAEIEKGTGIVMICTFGDKTDIEWWQKHNLELRIAITKDGRLNDLAGEFSGMKLKEARAAIIEKLKNEEILFKENPIKHAVNVHDRCKNEVEFLVNKQWFVKVLDLKEKFLELNSNINWYPSYMSKRFVDWVENLGWDWSISRQRYFGVPFPVWYCEKCGEEKFADDDQLPVDPLKDKPKTPCSCGSEEFIGEPDVLDTWATSGSTPQINMRYGDDDSLLEKIYPMDLRPQGYEIIRTWAFYTVVKGYMHHKDKPWHNVYVNGMVLDPKSKKMSKSIGNIVEPAELINKYSSDGVRAWSATTKAGEDFVFMEKDLVTGRKLLMKVLNASKFVGNFLENYDPSEDREMEFSPVDKWILSRSNSVKKEITDRMDNYQIEKGLVLNRDFFWLEFCDYYIEAVKKRVYSEEAADEKSKNAALYTLYNVLLDSLKMFSPYIPHITEEVYQTVFLKHEGLKSIHLMDWPTVDESKINDHAELLGKNFVDIVAALRKYKSENKLSLSQELTEVHLFVQNSDVKKMLEDATEDLRKILSIVSLTIIDASAPDETFEANEDIRVLVK